MLLAALSAAAIVLCVRLAAHSEREASPLSGWHYWTETDEHAAIAAAQRIAAGNWLDVPAYRPYFTWQRRFGTPEEWDAVVPRNVPYQGPAYPYLLALAGKASTAPVAFVRLAQLLLATLAASALAAAAAALLLRARVAPGLAAAAGALAGILHGTYGPLVFLDGFLYRDGPVAHVSALLLALPLLSARPPRAREGVLVGLVAGAGALLKQTLLPLGIVAGAALVLRTAERPARRRVGVAFAAALVVALAPLIVRNAVVGAPLLAFDTRPLVGIPWANARGADGSVNTSPLLMEVLRDADGSTLKAGLLTLRTWRDEPAGLPLLLVRKLASAFNGAEVPDNASFFFFRDRLATLAGLPLFPLLLGPGVAGLAFAARRGLFRRGEGLLVAFAGLVPLGACLLVSTTTRYRSGVAAPLALGAGLLVALGAGALGERRGRELVPYAFLAAVLSAQTFLPSPIRARAWRSADTTVAATLVEARISPEAGAAEVRRWLEEQRDAPDRERGLVAMKAWLSGRRDFTNVAPEAVAPPHRRYGTPR